MAVTTTLSPSLLTGAPGKVVGCDVVLVNHGEAVDAEDLDAVDIDVVGPAAAWVLIRPAPLAVPAGAEVRARLAFTIPDGPPATVGFAVQVRGVAAAEAEGRIEVAAVRDLALVVQPMMSRSRRASRHTVAVENRGNVAVQAEVTAVAPDDTVDVELSLRSVAVAPGEKASLAMVVAARRWSLARATRAHRFSVVATADAGLAAPAEETPLGAGAGAGAGTTATAEAVLFQEPLRWRPLAVAAVALLTVALFVWRSGDGGIGANGTLVTTDQRVADRGAEPEASPGAGSGSPCPAPAGEGPPVVAIATFAYCPSPITVASGSEVAWRNDDDAAHTVTSSDVPSAAGSFDSGVLTQDQSFPIVLDAPGAYHYLCTLHPGMRGTIVVTG